MVWVEPGVPCGFQSWQALAALMEDSCLVHTLLSDGRAPGFGRDVLIYLTLLWVCQWVDGEMAGCWVRRCVTESESLNCVCSECGLKVSLLWNFDNP